MIYHLLPELESFSAMKGGALARDIANIMRMNSSHRVACAQADETWGFNSERILLLPGLHRYDAVRAKRFLPIWVTAGLIRSAFKPLMARLQPGDVIWNHNQLMFSAALSSTIKAKGATLLHHFHDGHITYAGRSAMKAFVPDATIFVSDFLRRQWLDVFPTLPNTYAIPNGADERLFYPAPNKTENAVPTILFVGRLHPEKGAHVLVAAMKILQERGIEAICKVVGSATFSGNKPSPYVTELYQSSPPSVRYEGRKSGQYIADEYRSADILCCPSVWQEPFGNVNIEGMATGIPVVASKVGGIQEIAAEGGVLLVEPGSAIAIADALQMLIEDKELRKRVAAEGLKSFHRRYTWTAVCDAYREITDQLEAAVTVGA